MKFGLTLISSTKGMEHLAWLSVALAAITVHSCSAFAKSCERQPCILTPESKQHFKMMTDFSHKYPSLCIPLRSVEESCKRSLPRSRLFALTDLPRTMNPRTLYKTLSGSFKVIEVWECCSLELWMILGGIRQILPSLDAAVFRLAFLKGVSVGKETASATKCNLKSTATHLLTRYNTRTSALLRFVRGKFTVPLVYAASKRYCRGKKQGKNTCYAPKSLSQLCFSIPMGACCCRVVGSLVGSSQA